MEGEDTFRRIPPPPKPIPPPPPAGKHPLSPSERKEIDIWYRETGKEYLRKRAFGDGRSRVTDFAFTRDGHYILASYDRGECYATETTGRLMTYPSGSDPVRLWDVGSASLLWERVYEDETRARESAPSSGQPREGSADTLERFKVVTRVVPSPDGARFLTVSDGRGNAISMHDMTNGLRLYSLPLLACDPSGALDFTPDGRQFITSPTEKAACMAQFPSRGPFSASARECLRTASNLCHSLAVYDAKTGKETGAFSDRDGALTADLSPDGRWLVAMQDWNRWYLRVWDMETRRPVARYRPWRFGVIGLIRFQPSGLRLVVTQAAKGRVALYEVGP